MSGQFITSKQNEPEQIKRLAAKKSLYLKENRLNSLQMLLAVSTALVGASVQNFVKDSEPFVVIVSAFVALSDVLFFENLKGRWQQTAARIQEQFDCAVLDLPWRKLKSGLEPGPEVTAQHCQHFYDRPEEQKKLVDWYPISVKDLPLQPARIICQRENCIYDARLREAYIAAISVGLVLLSLVTLVIGLILNHDFVTSLAGMVAPLIPAYIIAFREIKQNKDALEGSKRLYEHAEELWNQAVNKSAPDQELDICARFLQDEIFDNRRRSPVIFDWFYQLFRSRNEALLTDTAAQLVNKYREKNVP